MRFLVWSLVYLHAELFEMTLRKLRGLPQDVTTFHARFNPLNTMPSIASRYAKMALHPLRPKIMHMYTTREKGILWWSVLHGELTPEKRIVRSVLARKMRRSFEEALKRKGFDKDGRSLEFDGKKVDDKEKAPAGAKGLVGTLEIVLQKPILEVDQHEVERQSGLLIDIIQKTLLKGPNKQVPKNMNVMSQS